MECDKLFKEALQGIDFRYKLDDTIAVIPEKQKFTKEQLEGYLLKKGVSPKEIKANGLFKRADTDKAEDMNYWREKLLDENHHLKPHNLGDEYEDITLNREGSRNESYTEMGDLYRVRTEYPKPAGHYGTEGTYGTSVIGHRRTHIDTINGKKTLVLNELQSDWAQAERSSDNKFVFESNVGNKPGRIVADFPMSPAKYTQYQIVRTLDDAIKQGVNRIAIPINREGNYLMGTPEVTGVYERLIKPLNQIKSKLAKQGLKINLGREKIRSDYGKNQISNIIDKKITENLSKKPILEGFKKAILKNGHIIDEDGAIQYIIDNPEHKDILVPLFKEMEDRFLNTNLHIITIEKIPNKKVNWDVYSILGALGLGGYATQSEAKSNYTVKRGDTLAKLAIANNTTVKDIIEENKLKSINLKVGQKLNIEYKPKDIPQNKNMLSEDELMQVKSIPKYLKQAENLGNEKLITIMRKHTIGYGVDKRYNEPLIKDVLSRIFGYNQRDINLIMNGKKRITTEEAEYLSDIVYTRKEKKLENVPDKYKPKLMVMEYYLPIAHYSKKPGHFKSINKINEWFKNKEYDEIINYIDTTNTPYTKEVRKRWKRAEYKPKQKQ